MTHLPQKRHEHYNKVNIYAIFGQKVEILIISSYFIGTGGCLLSREKAVNDVNSRVGFCFLVGVILNFDWSIFS